MSLIPSGLNRLLQFYLSGPMPCPYLPGRVERKLFTHLTGSLETDSEINAALTRAGFRRSHDILYRPACDACSACIPVRIPVDVFKPSRRLRRVASANRDLTVRMAGTEASEEIFMLFSAYQQARHPDSEMARMTMTDFKAMLQDGKAATQLMQLRAPDNRLMGGMIVDAVGDGTSAVYSFFDPLELHRSLGTQMVLALIEETRKQNLPYVYLGYWIEEARRMAYKGRFRPLQALGPGGWNWVSDSRFMQN